MNAVSSSATVLPARSARFGGSRAGLRSAPSAGRRASGVARTNAAIKEAGPAIVTKIHKVEVGTFSRFRDADLLSLQWRLTQQPRRPVRSKFYTA